MRVIAIERVLDVPVVWKGSSLLPLGPSLGPQRGLSTAQAGSRVWAVQTPEAQEIVLY